ncbi:ERI1 exoribonuclease 3 [Venturia canescens]|uniref:ERI1 exoribonuclease 3 n=1 Tax=Venturia canescens TaxID=32260 RepID=UPI001C9C46F1|nr:ERI1 exoribonuclease 3 [Venturia canescens]
MAHRLLGRGLIKTKKKVDNLRQPFNYLLILDFEATCEKNGAWKTPEIIEFPCIALNTKDWQIKDVFHQYVRPRINPILTPFCTELTGIMQEMVDKQPYFPEVFHEFQNWLEQKGFLDEQNPSALVTCGDWDLRVMLPNQCTLDHLEIPKYCEQWINLKKSFCEATNYYPRSLVDMLLRLDISHQGKLHSGLSDSQNMASIITELQKRHNFIFTTTSINKIDVKTTT